MYVVRTDKIYCEKMHAHNTELVSPTSTQPISLLNSLCMICTIQFSTQVVVI